MDKLDEIFWKLMLDDINNKNYQSFVNNIVNLKKIVLDIVLSTDQKIININKINDIFEIIEDIKMINQLADNNINCVSLMIDNLVILLFNPRLVIYPTTSSKHCFS